MTPASNDPCARPCLNCGEPIASRHPLPPARFCAGCGQETNVQPPRLGEFLQQFGGAYLSTEGALWRTLKLLLTKPGELTRLYLAGRRKHYVLPLRLYLTISVVALLLGKIAGGGSVEIKASEAEQIAAENGNFRLEFLGGRLGMADHVYFCERLPDWLCERARKRIDIDPKAMPEEVTRLKDRFLSNLSGAMFLLVPSFAAGLALVYRNRRLRYTEHLVFALHTHSFWFIGLAIMVSSLPLVSGLATLAIPIYGWLALKRVYGGRWFARLLRCGVVAVMYSFVLSLAMGGLGVWALLG